jgi:acetolactate decarboxylase
VLAASLACAAFAGCAAPAWNGTVQSWGTMREVMREGHSEGRVRLEAALADPECVAIGAMAGLRGEIAVVDGQVWIARVRGDRVEIARAAGPDDEAALLALAHVPLWSAEPVARELALTELGELVLERGRSLGLQSDVTVPFVVRGDFADLEAHVLDGRCPYGPPDSPGNDPVRGSFAHARGVLIGLRTDLPGGVLTHHGENVHVHVVVEGDPPWVGHVDAVKVLPGATLALPDAR